MVNGALSQAARVREMDIINKGNSCFRRVGLLLPLFRISTDCLLYPVPACKIPDLPFGAFIKSQIKSTYKTGDRIELGCKRRFKKIGNALRICISGKWTAFPFECKGEDCDTV